MNGATRIAVYVCTSALAVGAASSSGQAPADADRLRSEIRQVEAALPQIADRGAALYLLARLYTALGERDRARTLLADCVSLDQGFEPDTAALSPLQASAEIRSLAERFRRAHPPVHRASIAFTVDDQELFPEGLAYDPAARVFYLSSEYKNKIVKVDADRRVSDLTPAGRDRLAPVGGLRVDPDDHSLWAATDSAEFVHVSTDGDLIERFSAPDPAPHILNDLVVRRREVYVTDTRAHQVYRFDRTGHTFTPVRFHRPLFYPNGITFGPGEQLFVADMMGVVALDLRDGRSFDVNPGRGNTLAGIDGLYWYKDGFVGVQYGTGAYRVMRWALSRDRRTVRAGEILEYRTPLVSFATTGALVGGRFYFLANTGIANLKDNRIVDRSKLEPVNVAVVTLP